MMKGIGWKGLVLYLAGLASLSLPFVVPVEATPDTLPLPELSLPLPQDQESPVEPAPVPNSESGPAVVYEDRVVTEWVRSCDGRSCRLVPRQVVRRVAVAAARPVRTARVIFQGGVERTLELLRPVGAAVTCTRTTAQAQTGEQWMGTDEQIYVKQDNGTWKPKRADAKIPTETLSSPAVATPPIVTSQRVFYSTPYVTTTPYRARTPVFSRRCGPVRRLLGWCR